MQLNPPSHIFSYFIFLGGSRAFRACPRLPEGCPSGLAVAPKVASAPRGPGSANLAGKPLQSLPQAPR